MSNEKQTDLAHWKNRLDALDSLPDETADKNAAWEKLYGRLYDKPRRKKAVWYWAAACLIAICLLPFFQRKNTVDPLTKNTVKQKPLPAPVQTNATAKKEIVTVISNLPANIPAVKNATKKDFTKHSITSINKSNQPLVIDSVQNNVVTAIQIPVAQPDSAVVTIATVPAKKKLAVVNINELDAPPELAYSVQRKKHNKFNIKFGSAKTSGEAAVSRLNASDRPNLKISLNNN